MDTLSPTIASSHARICRICLRPARVNKRTRPRAFHSYDLHPSVCCRRREQRRSTRSDLRPAAVCPATRLPAPIRQESTYGSGEMDKKDTESMRTVVDDDPFADFDELPRLK